MKVYICPSIYNIASTVTADNDNNNDYDYGNNETLFYIPIKKDLVETLEGIIRFRLSPGELDEDINDKIEQFEELYGKDSFLFAPITIENK